MNTIFFAATLLGGVILMASFVMAALQRDG
jgi:hypothetical protein